MVFFNIQFTYKSLNSSQISIRMIANCPFGIWSNRLLYFIEVIHINISQRVTYDCNSFYTRQGVKKSAMPFYYTLSLLLRIKIIAFEILSGKVCRIISYWQSPIPFAFILKEICKVHQLVIIVIPSFGIFLHRPVTLSILILMNPSFKSLFVVRMVS